MTTDISQADEKKNLQRIQSDVTDNRLPRSSKVSRSFLINEYDFLKLLSLTTGKKTTTTSTEQKNDEKKDQSTDKATHIGGFNMAQPSQSDMDQLRSKINEIFDAVHSPATTNKLIMKLLLKTRRRKLLQRQRQLVPNDSSNFVAGAGRSIQRQQGQQPHQQQQPQQPQQQQ